jgi:hypothetical protein
LGLAAAAICAGLALAGCGDDDDGSQEADESGEGGTLYVLRADAGELQSRRDADGRLRLTLSGVSPTVVAFSDRPERSATTLTDSQLVRGWSDLGFASDPPNAALEFQRGPNRQDVLVAKISEPTVERSGALTFDARLIDAQQASVGLLRIAAHARNDRPGSFGDATLFIDDGGGEPASGPSCLDECTAECAANHSSNVEEFRECVAQCAQQCLPPEAGGGPQPDGRKP